MAEKDFYIRSRLLEVGKEVVAEMQKIIKSNNAVATGNLLNTLDYKVEWADNKWNLIFEYADYGYFVDKGRLGSMNGGLSPGNFPPGNAIRQWMSIKGLPEEAFWPIMTKIKKAGFYSRLIGGVPTAARGIHFTDPLLTNQRFRKVMIEFEKNVAVDIENAIVKEIMEETGKDVFTVIKR